MSFYTYLWLRYDGTPYYVGKGKNDRGFMSGGHRNINRPKDPARILIQNCESEQEAFEIERFLISLYGRRDLSVGPLLNKTDGGEGVCGLRHSEETKKMWSAKRKGIRKPPRTAEHCRNIALAKMGSRNPMFGKAMFYGRRTTKRDGRGRLVSGSI